MPEFVPEIPSGLVARVHDLFRFNLGITRQLQLQKVKAGNIRKKIFELIKKLYRYKIYLKIF